jgi:ABC-type transporter Mla MlaB component
LAAQAVLVHAVVPIIDWDLSALVQVDAGTVDALARLQLTARRSGARVRLRNASRELVELVDFMGLSEVLRVEAGGQAEEREHPPGVEKERELGDAAV